MSDQEMAFARSGEWSSFAQNGMTLRDYFAAKALNGLLAGNDCETYPPDCNEGSTSEEIYAGWSKMAYGYADAMIARRVEKKPE